MNCREANEQLSALLDDQLEPAERERLEAHLAACPLCQGELLAFQRVDALLREHLPRPEAPPHLKGEIFRQFRLTRIEMLLEGLRAGVRLRWALTGVALALAVLVWAVLQVHEGSQPSMDRLVQAAVANHVSSLAGRLPVEVADPDPSRVSAWFEGKLPFHAKVPDLSGRGVRLLGGRLCHIQGDDVAYVTYRRGGHPLSLFVFDGTGRDLPGEGAHHVMSTSAKGYQAVCWKRGSIGYLLVSNLGREALREIATHASWE